VPFIIASAVAADANFLKSAEPFAQHVFRIDAVMEARLPRLDRADRVADG